MSVIDLIEKHLPDATARPWRFTEAGEIVADVEPVDAYERGLFAGYGGKPVAESMETSDQIVTTLAVNAADDFVRLARATDALAAFDCASLHAEIAGPDGRCAFCALREAREPLFREVQP